MHLFGKKNISCDCYCLPVDCRPRILPFEVPERKSLCRVDKEAEAEVSLSIRLPEDTLRLLNIYTEIKIICVSKLFVSIFPFVAG